MTKVFSKFYPKYTQIRHFWSKFQSNLYFRKILQINKFEVADFRYGSSFFKIQPKNTNKKGIFEATFRHFFRKNLYNQTNLRMMNSFMAIVFLKRYTPKIPKSGIFEANLKFSPKNFQIRHFSYQLQAFLSFFKV